MIQSARKTFASEKGRTFTYAAVAGLFLLTAILLVLLKHSFNFVVSDGRGYYVYLPSVVIDHDLDFSNQIQEHWDVDFSPKLLEDKTPLGFVRNKYPVGFALSLLPSFTLAHVISNVVYNLTGSEFVRPDGYSLLYQVMTLATIMGCGFLMMVMLDRLLQRHFAVRGSSIALAILTFWMGSHYAYYYFREPIMVHVVSAFWITVCLYCGVEASRSPARIVTNLGMMFLAFAIAVVARPTNVFIAPFVAVAAFKALKQAPSRAAVWISLGLGCLATLPILMQMTVWKMLNGSWISYSYGSEGFIHFKNPFLFSTLFSSFHGLFFWSPVLLLALIGLVFRCREVGYQKDFVIAPLVCGAAILWYFNSSWHQWWFGDAFGGRAFLELAPLFIFGLAFFFESVSNRLQPSLRMTVAAIVTLLMVYNYALMALYIGHKIPRANYLF